MIWEELQSLFMSKSLNRLFSWLFIVCFKTCDPNNSLLFFPNCFKHCNMSFFRRNLTNALSFFVFRTEAKNRQSPENMRIDEVVKECKDSNASFVLFHSQNDWQHIVHLLFSALENWPRLAVRSQTKWRKSRLSHDRCDYSLFVVPIYSL